MELSKSLIKPELNSSDTSSISSQGSRDQPQQPNIPEWINEFSKECVKICGTRCSEKLDEIMEAYIKEIKQELVLCDTSPNRASLIANRMSKTLLFFYLYYSDIKEFFVISQWNENISLLLLFYCRLELKAAHRVHRGKDSDSLVCSRIMNALWIYLSYNCDAMIHVVLQIPGIGRRHKDILDPIFRKLLLNKKQKPLTELEYIRNLLAFKLWKRLYCKDDKKAISHLALTELRPPRSFLTHHRKYKFLPQCPNSTDIHMQFVTGLIDLDNAIKEYLDIYNKHKRTDYHPTEKKSFISEFCSSFEGIETTSDDLSDNYMLDKIKNENDIEEIEDDDCIIVEPVDAPPPIVRIDPPDPTEVIDLTADEPENQINITEADEVPIWCKELIKQSESSKITPPPTPVADRTVENLVEHSEEVSVEPSIEESVEHIDVITQKKDLFIPERELSSEDIISSKVRTITPEREIAPFPTTNDKVSEENSLDITEITSTSHPVSDTDHNIADSSVFTPEESFPEQSVKDIYSVNFEHVDSTSNINEEEPEEEPELDESEIEEPTIKTFVVDRTVVDGVVCSEVISELTAEPEIQEEDSEQTVSAVSNIEFEKFASAQTVSDTLDNNIIITQITGKSDDIVDTSRQVSDSDDLNEDILDENSCHIDPGMDGIPPETNLLMDKMDKESEGSINSHTEIEEFTSPAIEPMSVKDFANYLAGYYEEFRKQPESVNGETTLNKKRKIEDHTATVRTYTRRTPKLNFVPESAESNFPEQELLYEAEQQPQIEPVKEQRVPANGERVIRFEADLFKEIVTGGLKITSKDYKLFAPVIVMKNDNPRYWVPDIDAYSSSSNASSSTNPNIQNESSVEPQVPVFENLHTFNTGSTSKKILERQDYLKSKKGEENPRVRVIRRPTVGFVEPMSKDPKMPELAPQTKKRGSRKQASTEVVKKRKVGRRKSTRHPAESLHPTPVEQNPETPWRFSFL